MNREQKSAEIEILKAKFAKAQIAILSDYKGLKVNDFNSLRGKLRKHSAEIMVVKNRLAKIALKGTHDDLVGHFKGTTAVTFAQGDPTGVAKVLVEFAKEFLQVRFKSAYMSGKKLSSQDIEALASLPSREELVLKLIGSMQAPAQNLVRVLAQIPRQVVQVLAAIRDKKEVD